VYDDAARVRSVTVLRKAGAIEQTGVVGPIRNEPLGAAAVGSELTPDLDRQALLQEIAQEHAMTVSQLAFFPSGGRGTVTVAGTPPDDEPRMRGYLQALCTSETGLLVARKSNGAARTLTIEELLHRDGQYRARFRCKR
jgi:hypothetical protein